MNVTKPVHVSITSDSKIQIQSSHGFSLISELGGILRKYGKEVVLHHCGCSLADNIARTFAARVGWRLEAHPASKTPGMIPWQAAATGTQAEVVHLARDRGERDRVLRRVADVVVALDSDWGVRTRLVNEARAAERETVYARQEIFSRNPAMAFSGIVHDWLVNEPN
jgi:hypothetical protein